MVEMIIIFHLIFTSVLATEEKETLFQKINIPLVTWKNATFKYTKKGVANIQECGMFCSLPYLNYNTFHFTGKNECIVANVSCRYFFYKLN